MTGRGVRVDRGRLVARLIVVGFCALAVIPLYWAVKVSLTPSPEVVRTASVPWPTALSIDGYRRALVGSDDGINEPMLVAVANSTVLSLATGVTQVASCSAVAWMFVRSRLRGKEVLFSLLIGAMALPTILSLAPNLITVRDLDVGVWGRSVHLGFLSPPGRTGWAGTLVGIAAPSLFFQPVALLLLRQAFASVPTEIVDAAVVDGAGSFRLFRSIAVPLALPTIAGVAVLSYLDAWNAFLWPLLIAPGDGPTVATVALSQARYQLPDSALPDWQLLMSATVVASLPVLVAYILAGRYVEDALASLGVARSGQDQSN